MPEKVQEVIERIHKLNVKLDGVVYAAMVSAYCHCGLLQDALGA